MAIDADSLIDRMRLKKLVKKWQALAMLSVVIAIFVVAITLADFKDFKGRSYIAKIEVDGVIFTDNFRDKAIKKIKEENCKAVIVSINSTGGTIVASEELHNILKQVSSDKPVVTIIKDYAASGGYMVAVAGEKIFARNGSVVGSIGVLAQNFEITELAKSLGVDIFLNKTSDLKAAPNPFEKPSDKAINAQSLLLEDFFEYFKQIIKTSRGLTEQELAIVSDGRVFTGRQAIDLKLVDAIGGEEEAVKYLVEKHQIQAKIVDVKTVEDETVLKGIMGSLFSYIFGENAKLDNLIYKNSTPKFMAVMSNDNGA